ncbi:MAG: hypothetical protein ACREJD_06830 [Phycisphaerales bacterium]
MTDATPIIDPAHDPIRFLHRHFAGVVTADDVILPRNFVIDPLSGEIVASLPPSVEEAESVVLHVPDESRTSLQLMVRCRSLDAARDASCDRLLIYHGRAEGAKFASMRPIDAKWEAREVKIENFLTANPLAAAEPRLCRLLNADAVLLATLVMKLTGRETIEPKAVGVDDVGMDVRTRTGVVRAEFADRLIPQEAVATIEAWVRKP